MKEKLIRVNITLNEKLHKKVHTKGLNLSGLVREKLEDHFSNHTITFSVDKKLKNKYEELTSILNISDSDIQPFIDQAINEFIKVKKKELNLKMNKMINS